MTHYSSDNRRGPSTGSLRATLLRRLLDGGSEMGSLETSLLRTSEVALLFQVSRRTVIAWAREGKLPFITTPGGHRRYPAREVLALLESASEPSTGAAGQADRRAANS